MANSTIFGLTQETALGATDRFILQQTSSATTATSATFALMGGLSIVAGSDASITMAVGTLYTVNVSAFTADRTYSLPASGNVGERIGIYITSGSASFELTAGTWSKLFITGESVIFVCTGGSTWVVLHDGRIPCVGAYSGTVSVAHGGVVQSDLSTFSQKSNRGNMADTVNDHFNIRRNGLYLCNLVGSTVGLELDTGEGVMVKIGINTGGGFVDEVPCCSQGYSPATNRRPQVSHSAVLNASDGNSVRFAIFQNEGTTQDCLMNLSIVEIM